MPGEVSPFYDSDDVSPSGNSGGVSPSGVSPSGNSGGVPLGRPPLGIPFDIPLGISGGVPFGFCIDCSPLDVLRPAILIYATNAPAVKSAPKNSPKEPATILSFEKNFFFFSLLLMLLVIFKTPFNVVLTLSRSLLKWSLKKRSLATPCNCVHLVVWWAKRDLNPHDLAANRF